MVPTRNDAQRVRFLLGSRISNDNDTYNNLLVACIDLPSSEASNFETSPGATDGHGLQSLSEDGKILTGSPKEVPLLIQVTASLRNLASNQYKQFLTEDWSDADSIRNTHGNPKMLHIATPFFRWISVQLPQHDDLTDAFFGWNLLWVADLWWRLMIFWMASSLKGTSTWTFGRKICRDDTTWTAWNEDEPQQIDVKPGFIVGNAQWFVHTCSMLDFGGIWCLNSWAWRVTVMRIYLGKSWGKWQASRLFCPI